MSTAALEATEAMCARDRAAPRVSLQDIENAIVHKHFTIANKTLPGDVPALTFADSALSVMTLCFLVMRNGFVVVGKAAPASPDNFNAELGQKLAYENAVHQVWPLMGYALRDRLAE